MATNLLENLILVLVHNNPVQKHALRLCHFVNSLLLFTVAAHQGTHDTHEADHEQQNARLGVIQRRGSVQADLSHAAQRQAAVVQQTLDALDLGIGQRVALARQNDREHLVVRCGLAEGQNQVVSHGLQHLHGAREGLVVVPLGHGALLGGGRLPGAALRVVEAQQVLDVGAPLVPGQPDVAGRLLVLVISTVVVAVVARPEVLRGGEVVGHLRQVQHHTGIVGLLLVRAILVGNHLGSVPHAHYLQLNGTNGIIERKWVKVLGTLCGRRQRVYRWADIADHMVTMGE